MDFRTFDAGLACVDFFLCGMYYAHGDTKKAVVFGVLGLILYFCAVWRY